MPTVATFLFRAILIAAGTVFALSLTFVLLVLLAAWSLRAGWARLTGGRVTPFVVRVGPRDVFERMFRREVPPTWRPSMHPVAALHEREGTVTDVRVKSLRP